MRRMVGATMLVGILGGATVGGWWSTRGTGGRIDSLVVPAVIPSDSTAADGRPPARLSIDYLPDPLAFLSFASPDSLDLLPGVGPVLATRLVAARREHGPFRTWDDVDRVRGIGPKTIERLKALERGR
jgi:competence ComEA-like helix-hairpin-helix protein